VKRIVIVAGGALALGAVIYAGRLWADPGTQTMPATPAARTRIALLNMTYVMKWYNKFKTYQEELKQTMLPYTEKDKGLRAQADAIVKEMKKPDKQGQTAELEKMAKDLKDIKRNIEDNEQAANVILSKRGDEQLKTLYFDVMDAASRYARAHDFELVLHYNDATTREEFVSSGNIGRKLQNGALMPLYAVQGLDISREVVENLNAAMGTAATSPSAPAGGGAGAAPGTH
jgi:Skp family chaperone for outer membrane proteins